MEHISKTIEPMKEQINKLISGNAQLDILTEMLTAGEISIETSRKYQDKIRESVGIKV